VTDSARRRARLTLLAAGAVALALVAGFAVGRTTAPQPQPDTAPPAGPVLAERDWLPAHDAPGQEIPGLPRFPGSVRVDFDRQAAGGVVVTDADYLTGARLAEVHRFYRAGLSRHGWRVANVSFVRGEWSFLALRGRTEAVLQIATRGPLVEVDIEQRRPSPIASPARSTAGPPVGTGSRRA
jgi:hypothetical protein